MADLRDQLVLLQEAGELCMHVPCLGRIAQHLQHDHLPCPLALGEIHHRRAADGELAHEAMAQNRHRAELRLLLGFGRRAHAARAAAGGGSTASRSTLAMRR